MTERARGFASSSELFFDPVRDETLVLDFGVSAITAICRDTDRDGTCDADEPCMTTVSNAKLAVKKLGAPVGDEKLTLKGEITVPAPITPALDPVTKGVRVRLKTALGATRDVTVPPGALDKETKTGWKANKGLTSWTFSSSTPLGALGLTKVVVKTKPKTPGLVTFAVTGKDATLALAPADLPLGATLLIDTSGHCGTATFTGPDTGCAFNRKQTAVTCK